MSYKEKVVIGDCTLYLGDCVDVLKELEADSIDLILVDTPYGNNYSTSRRKDKSHKFTKPIQNDNDFSFLDFFINIFDKLKENKAIYSFCDFKNIHKFRHFLDKVYTYKNTIIWDKGNRTAGDLYGSFGVQCEALLFYTKGRVIINGYRYSDLWSFKKIVGNEQVHQNQKPVELLERCIKSVTQENDTALDAFMGSGSTGVACVNTNRKFIGVEIDKEYFDIAVKRIKKAYNEKLSSVEYFLNKIEDNA